MVSCRCRLVVYQNNKLFVLIRIYFYFVAASEHREASFSLTLVNFTLKNNAPKAFVTLDSSSLWHGLCSQVRLHNTITTANYDLEILLINRNLRCRMDNHPLDLQPENSWAAVQLLAPIRGAFWPASHSQWNISNAISRDSQVPRIPGEV